MDKYDEQIAELTSNPDNISFHWFEAIGLFAMVDRTHNRHLNKKGCLTIIRNNPETFAYIKGEVNLDLTRQIREDERIPKKGDLIRVDHLPVFAEWQRKIDQLENA